MISISSSGIIELPSVKKSFNCTSKERAQLLNGGVCVCLDCYNCSGLDYSSSPLHAPALFSMMVFEPSSPKMDDQVGVIRSRDRCE